MIKKQLENIGPQITIIYIFYKIMMPISMMCIAIYNDK